MTESAAMAPTKLYAVRNYLRRAYEESVIAETIQYSAPDLATMHASFAVEEFQRAASALGLHVSAEPAAQQPQSDLVKRLRETATKYWEGSNAHHELNEAADRIEALEAELARIKSRPDPLGEALNSGDGVYRP